MPTESALVKGRNVTFLHGFLDIARHGELAAAACVILLCACSSSAAPAHPRQPITDVPIEVDGPLEPPLFLYGSEAGGSANASDLGPGCTGWVQAGPNHRLAVRESMPFLRIMALGGLQPGGTLAQLVLAVRGPDGSVRCSEGAPDAAPIVDGFFPVGEYEVFVGARARGSVNYYRLGVASSADITPSTIFAAIMSSTPGLVTRRTTLEVASATGGPLSSRDPCAFEQVVGSDGRLDQSVMCGATALWRGRREISDPGRAAGAVVVDAETTAEDGSPAFLWDASGLRMHDDSSGHWGVFEVEFRELPFGPVTP